MVKNDPAFPKPFRFGTFSAVFKADEVAKYLNNLTPAADAPVHHEGKVHLHENQEQSSAPAAPHSPKKRPGELRTAPGLR